MRYSDVDYLEVFPRTHERVVKKVESIIPALEVEETTSDDVLDQGSVEELEEEELVDNGTDDDADNTRVDI